MSRILSDRHEETSTTYRLDWQYCDMPGAGLTFPATKDGYPDTTDMAPEAIANLVFAFSDAGRVQLDGPTFNQFEWTQTVPALLACDCGQTVELTGFTNTCDHCDRDYNMSGSLLAPRSQWGEETGESLSDILRIP